MRRCRVTIAGLSPYSQSAAHDTPELDREGNDDYDARTWREKCTINAKGEVCIPAMAIKQMLDTTAFKLGEKVPNRKGAMYRSFFASGVNCTTDPIVTNGTGKAFRKADAIERKISANPRGIRGGSGRVPRRFPEFHDWHAVVEVVVIDDIVTRAILEQHLRAAGMIVGIGRFRPENGGTNGRFRVEKIEWDQVEF